MIMKRILLFAIALGFAISSFAQQRAVATQELRNIALPMKKAISETMNFSHETLPQSDVWPPVEDAVIYTRYDLQSNTSCQNRMHVFPDGTIGVVCTYGEAETQFPERGSGYNYYDGSSWGDLPEERVEPVRTGWPSYAPYGENGEIIVTHIGTEDGLQFSYRNEKGTGDWQYFTFAGPAEAAELLWPRMVTGGVDNSVIHLISLTAPAANGGPSGGYQGMDGALLYSRSSDGGATWDPQNYLDPQINSDYFLAISGDTYEISARGDVVAFLIGDAWTDFVMMKSEDAGVTWNKTTIWPNTYPLWTTGTVTDTFYCADGGAALSIDQTGKVHVAFSINRAISEDGTSQSWYPYVDGLAYWNEDRPTFSSDKDALSPYGDEGTELVEDYSLIGWAQDVNENGVWDVIGGTDALGLYYVGASSHPQIVVDDNNYVYVVYSSLTETYDNGVQNFRHLWARVSPNGGEWWGSFEHLTSDLIHIFDECVFPSMSQYTDDNIYIAYQVDQEPGLAVRGDEDPYGDNYINVMKVSKEDLEVGIHESGLSADFEVAQNSPNPFSGSTTISVNVKKAADLSLEVTNMMGQVVYTYDAGHVGAGVTKINVDGSELSKGVYFYTVKAGKQAITNKMIVE